MHKVNPYTKMIKHFKEKCPPISVQLNITNACACKCIMCKKHEWNLGSIPLSDAKTLINHLSTMGTETIVLSGGDPLAYSKLEELIKYIHSKNIQIGILTAGNIYIHYWKEILPLLTWLRFSVDAADETAWSEIRGSNRFNHLINNLTEVSNLFRSYGDCKVRFNFCKIKGVNEDQEEKTKKLAESFGFSFMAHDVRTFEEYMHTQTHNDIMVSKCIVPFCHCIIESDGTVFPCCTVMNENDSKENVHWEYSLGNLKEVNWDFNELWNSSKATSIKKFFYDKRIDECKTCPQRYYSANIEYAKQENQGMFL